MNDTLLNIAIIVQTVLVSAVCISILVLLKKLKERIDKE